MSTQVILIIGVVILFAIWSFVMFCAGFLVAIHSRKFVIEDDDDVDGNNYDETDPADWWKTESGRAKNRGET